ncbi:MAG: hypothetical protein JRD88_02160, partial [Deltaproteobacteria bacterium]|nr:hypothetical protein [Deltaproteobacteria bacterium]
EAKHKLPYIITRIANALDLSTFTLQHGFENVGLTYCDNIHGPDVKFEAKTVLTWGPTKELPAWVEENTRKKCVAVGCPKKLAVPKNNPSVKPGDRPIIGVFDNLHWHRYDDTYRAKFLDHLEDVALQRQDLRFVLKSHPDSVRNRNQALSARLLSMRNVEIADMHGEDEQEMTTPLLMAKATGVITTPSTIALDGSLAEIPVAICRYELDLDYYKPLFFLDDLEDWFTFLNDVTHQSGRDKLALNGKQFLDRTLVNGDPAANIINVMEKSVTQLPVINIPGKAGN